MTAAYLGSSAIVKLYANEAHHQVVRGLDRAMITSSLARVEVTAAFYGKARSGEIDTAIAQILTETFTADWMDGRYLPITPNPTIETLAAQFAARYELRGFDALHLATAATARQAVPDCDLFVCFDKRLNAAAAGEHFRLVHLADQ